MYSRGTAVQSIAEHPAAKVLDAAVPPTWNRLLYAAIAQLEERRPFKAGQRW